MTREVREGELGDLSGIVVARLAPLGGHWHSGPGGDTPHPGPSLHIERLEVHELAHCRVLGLGAVHLGVGLRDLEL